MHRSGSRVQWHICHLRCESSTTSITCSRTFGASQSGRPEGNGDKGEVTREVWRQSRPTITGHIRRDSDQHFLAIYVESSVRFLSGLKGYETFYFAVLCRAELSYHRYLCLFVVHINCCHADSRNKTDERPVRFCNELEDGCFDLWRACKEYLGYREHW